MEIMVIRARVLAETSTQVWIAVSGTLGPTTEPRLREELRVRDDGQRSKFSVDLRELRCGAGRQAEAIRGLFAFSFDARFHLINAPEAIRMCAAGDPRFTLHATVESAWNMWE
ncbi:hypothetical protein P1P68_08070 [Streptomyces scabiei]|uniref:hypothetical protein n=1 Tax=Streptomyces scabiei TaxID=1930 RepID=UPI0029907970|nr:hypothetical protein [Streptomyces scabiei]MDW8804742.1 hypothetical protein [Streptomyces scabiei]